jgi:hypothetical protein
VTSPSPAGTTSRPTAAAESPSTAKAAVLSLLGSYQAAYSSHDGQGLEDLLSPSVIRHGLTASGCAFSRGKAAVLASYASQFASGSGRYRLLGLTPTAVELRGAAGAHLNSRYDISPGGSGSVSFTFTKEADGWKISQVYATCA